MTETLTDRCGTYAGYQVHLKREETPCTPCRKANREYHRQHRATHPDRLNRESAYNGARDRALTRLAHIHSALYEALLAEELNAAPTSRHRSRGGDR